MLQDLINETISGAPSQSIPSLSTPLHNDMEDDIVVLDHPDEMTLLRNANRQLEAEVALLRVRVADLEQIHKRDIELIGAEVQRLRQEETNCWVQFSNMLSFVGWPGWLPLFSESVIHPRSYPKTHFS